MRFHYYFCSSLLFIASFVYADEVRKGQTASSVEVIAANPWHLTANGPKTVLSKAQIKSSGATSLYQVLNDSGSMQLYDMAGNQTRVALGLRGFGGNAMGNTVF